MFTEPALSTSRNYALAKIVSNAGLKRLLIKEDLEQYANQIKSLLSHSNWDLNQNHTLKELIELSYSQLTNNYRHEYLYKNALLNSYVLKNYSLADTILLNEFRIGNSKADAVLVNGTNKAFEIKTELDTPERLNGQLKDYFKAFSEVYVITHHSLTKKYLSKVQEHVGIMTLTNDNSIEVVREATVNQTELDIVVMMKALRKDEYLSLVKSLLGYIPMASPIKIFSTCVESVKHLSPISVQAQFLNVIKRRINITTNEIISCGDLPEEIKFCCYNNNLKQKEYLALMKKLTYQI